MDARTQGADRRVARHRVVWLVLTLLAAPVAMACHDNPPTRVSELRELDRAAALWRNRGFRNYRMEVAIDCFCPMEMTAPAVVTVQGVTIVDVRYRDGTPVLDPFRNSRPVVDTLFRLIGDALESDEYARVDLEFDPAVGYPKRASFITPPTIADGGVTYTIRMLNALP